MTDKEKQVRKISNKIKKCLVELGTYKAEYDITIHKLSEIEYQIIIVNDKFESDGAQITVTKKGCKGAENEILNPLLIHLDKLRTSALAYYKELGLTTQSFKKISGENVQETKKNSLELLIEEIEKEIAVSDELMELRKANEKLEKELNKMRKEQKQ